MSRLIRTPGGYWTAFFQGFLGTLGVIGGPMIGFLIEARPTPGQMPSLIGWGALIAVVAGLLVGLICVVPRWLYAWAYRRFTQI